MKNTRSIGRKILALRKSFRLSQAQLAKKAGIRQAHLSLIENDKHQVTIKILQKILDALNQNLASFFSDVEEEEEFVYPSGSYVSIPAANDTHVNKLLTPVNGGRKIGVIRTAIQPGGNLGEPHNHRGEEFGIVLQGRGVLFLDGREQGIKEGDRYHFRAELMHTIFNPSSQKELHLLVVCSPPAF